MSACDKRSDWALPGSECWVAEADGHWVKGRVVSFAGGGYIVLIDGENSRTAKKREHEIRPRDMYNYGKDKPDAPPVKVGERRK